MTAPRPLDADFVARALLPAYDRATGATRSWRVSAPLHRRDASERHAAASVFKAVSADGESLGVKAFAPQSPGPLREALDEYAALEWRRAQMDAGAGFRSPRPRLFVAEHNAILMEWIDGRKVNRLLMASALAPRTQARWLGGAGRWLRALHEAGSSPVQPFGGMALAQELDRRAAGVRAAGRLSGRLAPLDRHLAWFAQAAATLDGTPAPQAILHDDFAPKNLIATPQGIAGVDITTLNRGPVCRDISEFMLYFDLFDPVGTLRADAGFTNGRLRAFLDGYDPGWNGVAPDRVALRYAFSALRMWLEIADWSVAGDGVWRRLAPRYPFHRLDGMIRAARAALANAVGGR
jgi:aminoglycoside phosphotransferase (APT) family kinase protein